jgi:2-oxoglutarate dehydrogenase complex dehydrogenase (E1) component-like enzyme
MGVEQFVMGMAHRGYFNIFGKSYIFGEFEGITIKNILTVMLSII